MWEGGCSAQQALKRTEADVVSVAENVAVTEAVTEVDAENVDDSVMDAENDLDLVSEPVKEMDLVKETDWVGDALTVAVNEMLFVPEVDTLTLADTEDDTV